MEKTTANAVFSAFKNEKKTIQKLLRDLDQEGKEIKGLIFPPDFGNLAVLAFLDRVKKNHYTISKRGKRASQRQNTALLY